MKKYHILLWIAGITLFVISVLYLLHLSQRDDDFFLEESSEAINEVTETTTSYSTNEQNVSAGAFLENFGNDWLNFSSISERNQQVEKYMTDNAIENAPLEANEKDQQESTGSIKAITQDIEDPQRYILLGEEITQDESKEVILEVKLINEPSQKISHFEFNYKE